MHSVSVLTLFSSSPFLACLPFPVYCKHKFTGNSASALRFAAHTVFQLLSSPVDPALFRRTLSWLNHHRIFHCSINAGTAISAQKSSLHRLAVHTTIFSCFRNVPKAMNSFSPRSVQYSVPQHRLRTTLSYSASISRTKTSRDLTREFRCWQIC